MSSLNRAVPLATSALVFLLMEVVYRRPAWIFGLGVGVPLILFLAIYAIMGRRLKTPATRFKFLITPTFLTWSALTFALVIESALARHLLAVLVALFLVLFFESIITYIWRHDAYLTYSLENLSAYALTLSVFLGVSTLLGFSVLLDLSGALLGLIVLLSLAAINYGFFWVSKLSPSQIRLAALTLTLTLTELWFAFDLLPLHFVVSGAMLTVLWYTAASILRAHFLGVLTRKMVYRHLTLASVLLAILMVTASV